MELIIGAVVLIVLVGMFAGLCGNSRRTARATRETNRRLANLYDARALEDEGRVEEARKVRARGSYRYSRWSLRNGAR